MGRARRIVTGSNSESEEAAHLTLEGLENEEMRSFMDAVHSLRDAGLEDILQLPQIVVCGQQSCGKSSVLEAIAGIPFPRDSGMCTTFPTAITHRHADHESTSVKIIPDPSRPDEKIEHLKRYKVQLTSFAQLPTIITKVSQLVAPSSDDTANNLAFSRDILSIEVSGPSRPNLTVVDLPGLICATNDQQNSEDIAMINEIVEAYIKQPRTVVLAVIQASVDQAVQDVTEKVKELEATGRTIGVVTKPDCLEAGTKEERSWVDLVYNRRVVHLMGWHVLKNRSPKEGKTSQEDRDLAEATFFRKGVWREVDPEMLGIKALRQRLCQLQFERLRETVPLLSEELSKNIADIKTHLDSLGHARSDTRAQRNFLLQLGKQFENLVSDATKGDYDNDFFSTTDPSKPVDDVSNMTRLRAVVVYSSIQFGQQMRKYGAKYNITGLSDLLSELSIDDDGTDEAKDNKLQKPYNQTHDQKNKTYRDMLTWAVELLQRSRGSEIPGTTNPKLITSLFKEQCEHWESIADAHITQVHRCCVKFCQTLLHKIAPPEVWQKLWTRRIMPQLLNRLACAREKLSELTYDEMRGPLTYNPSFISLVERVREKVVTQKVLDKHSEVPALWDPITRTNKPNISALLSNTLSSKDKITEVDKFAAEEALHCQMAYYKVELTFFIDAVAKQCIERCLIDDLEEIIYPTVELMDMADNEIREIAKEPHDIVRTRTYLEGKLRRLEDGSARFRAALGQYAE